MKNACFHFFHSIFSKSKYMSHPFSISTYRKSKIAPMRHNCVAGINFSGKTAVSKILMFAQLFNGYLCRYVNIFCYLLTDMRKDPDIQTLSEEIFMDCGIFDNITKFFAHYRVVSHDNFTYLWK